MRQCYPKHKALALFIATFAVIIAVFTPVVPARAQFYNGSQLTFGKNRVQYTDRFWSYLRFEKFDTYFYLEGKPTAIFTARYAEKCIKEMQRKFDYELEDKIQFVIFNKLSDLRQSNIGLLGDDEYNVGGITHIVGSKVFLYFDGNHNNLEKQIRAGIATIIVDEMMYGGRITAMIKNSALLNLPDWYLKGLIAYASEDWSTETDNQVKDGIMRGDYRKFNNLTGMDAAWAGQSIWKYIADKYGTGSIANIVYLTKISRNVESGFLYVLGVSFNTLITDWVNYYEQQYTASEADRIPVQGTELVKKVKKGVVYSQLRISPDGRYASWVTNDLGKIKVWLRDLETGKTKLLKRSGHKLDEKTDYSFPLLAWHPSGKLLAYIFEAKGNIYMNFYTVDDGLTEKQRLFNVEKVLDFSFAQNGKLIAMSAIVQGHSDIYVYNIAAHTYEPVTRDIWDDFQPHFVNNSSQIIFASNRPSDTIVYEAPTNFETASDTISELPDHTDLFLYSYSKKDVVMKRVTNSPLANESCPLPYSKSYFTYLSDENGVSNRYLARLDSAISFIDTATHYRYYTTSFPVTDYNRGIMEQDMVPEAGKSAELIFTDGRYKMFISEAPKPKEVKKVSPGNTFYMDQLLREQLVPRDTSAGLNQDEIEYIKKKKQKKTKRVTNVLVDQLDVPADSGAIDINNYQFSSDYVVPDTVIRKRSFTIPRAENYNVEYSINQLVSQADFNFLNSSYQQFTGGGSPVFLNPGFNALFKIGIIDLMEDYRVTGGLRLSVSLDNTEFFISFDNLKKRLDKSLVFHRQALLTGDDYSIIKLRSNSLYYILKWPFSHVLALKGTISARQDKKIYASTDIQNLKQPVITDYWAGLKGELIFDNTRNKGVNLYYGSRWKLFGEYFQKVGNEFNEMVVLGLDYRHYQKIHKTFIWANRIAASTSFGNSKLIYYLGGVDNWIIPKFNNDISVSQNQNYAFQTLATNMRGFTQNIRNGNNFAVINSELRFPIFRYFSKKPIKSDFFNNFQIVGFGDIGTAWTGWNPWSEENTVFKKYYFYGPITVMLKDIRDPVVGGMGCGLRTRILGYFLRLDYAWGVENLEIQKPVFYISLSTDF